MRGSAQRPRSARRAPPDDDRPRSQLRPLPRARDDDDLRQPGLDGAADAAARSPRTSATCSGCRRRSWSAWPTASRRRAAPPTLVNLHTAPGVGNGDGRDLQRPGQQVAAARHRRPAGARADDAAGEPDQPRRDRACPQPLRQVELRAAARAGRARTRSRGRSTYAALPPQRPGRSSRSRWTTGRPRSTPAPSRHQTTRTRRRARARRTRRGRASSPQRLRAAEQPGARRRARHRRQPAAGTPRSRSPSASGWPVWATPAPGGGRLGFPEDHPLFQGVLPPGDRPGRRRRSTAYDLVLVAGSSVFPYYPNIPGAAAARGRPTLVAITSDPDEAARAPMGDAIVADVALTLDALLGDARRASDRDAPPGRGRRPRSPTDGEPLSSAAPSTRRSPRCSPSDGIVVLESPSSTLALRNQLRLSRPGSYYFGAGGGLGFGLSARDRRPARPARAPGRLRARRGLGAVRDHGASGPPPPTRCRSRSSSCATTSTRSSSGSRARAGRRARPASTCPALDVAATARELRRRGRARVAGATSCARRCSEALGGRRPAARRGRGRARHGARLSDAWRCSRPTSTRIGRPPGRRRAGPRARQRSPPGRRSRCARELDRAARRGPRAARARSTCPLRLRREPLPAVPAGGRDGARRRRRRARCSPTRARTGTPRDLPRRRHEPQRPGADATASWSTCAGTGRGRRASRTAARARASGRARCSATRTACSRRHGYKLGPDPGEHRHRDRRRRDRQQLGRHALRRRRWDSYSTVASMTLVLASGTVIDTAAPDAEQRFAAAEPELARGLLEIRDELRADDELARARPAQVRDQEHHRLPAVRVPRRRHAARDLPPAASSARRARSRSSPRRCSRRVPSRAHTTIAWLHFPTSRPRPSRSPALVAAGARAAELMVAPALIAAACNMPGTPEYWKELPPESAALLVEFGGDDAAELDAHVEARRERSSPATSCSSRAEFTRDHEADRARLDGARGAVRARRPAAPARARR